MTRERTGTTVAYQENDIFAVMKKHDDAKNAVRDLFREGFRARDVHIFHGAEAVERTGGAERGCDFAEHIARALWGVSNVQGVEFGQYAAEGHAGEDILSVHTESPEQLEKACEILTSHGARDIEYFGHGRITAPEQNADD